MPNTFTLRPISAEDDAAVAAIIRAVMTEHGASGPGFAIVDPEVDRMSDAYAAPRHRYLVVVDEAGRVVGGAGIAPLSGGDERTCELRKMYFLPEARGRGVGAQALSALLDFARQAGFSRCYLETLTGMDRAMRLYEKAGFRRIDGPRGCTGHFSCDRFYEREL